MSKNYLSDHMYRATAPLCFGVSRKCVALLVAVGFLQVTNAEVPLALDVEEVHGSRDEIVAESPLMTRFGEAVQQLESFGLLIDDDVTYRNLIQSILESTDPLASLLSDDMEESIRRRRDGWTYDAGIVPEFPTEGVRISGVRDEEHDALKGAVLLRINEHAVENQGLFTLKRALQSSEPVPVCLVVRDGEGHVTTQLVERVAHQLSDLDEPELLPFQLGYLRVNVLREETGEAITAILDEWAESGSYGALLDLRGADGSSLEAVGAIAERFATAGTFLFAYRDLADQDLVVRTAAHDDLIAMPLMVLVDDRTGGAAEVLAAVLSDSVRGVMLFGQQTSGDLLIRDLVQLDDQLAAYIAIRRLVTGGGKVFDGMVGVRPDVVTALADISHPPTRSTRTAILDEQVEQEAMYNRIRGDATMRRAVDVLLGLKALDIRPN